MGSDNSKNIQEQPFDCENPKFKDSKVVSDHAERYIQAKFPVQNQQYDQWFSSVNGKNQKPGGEYLLLPIKIDFKHDKGLCGNSGTLVNDYPYYPYLLSEEIKGRQPDHKLFKEADLWYLLYSLVAAKQELKNYVGRIGDVKPQNIFINVDGNIKVANIFSWPNQLTNYQKLIDVQQPSFNVLLAPEDFINLEKGSPNNNSNKNSQIFSIGATVLSAGILDDLSSLYNYKDKIFNSEELKKKVAEWAGNQKYSEIFKSVVLNLVDLNENNRLTADEFQSWISKYRESIKAREQFLIAKAPAKIERHLGILRSKAF